jgi:aspartyl-tRNA(Asn)/glutamyl-tRNA(Gln) amidotransferase subunit B
MGLEIHSQLATKTKIFCGCSTEFGGEPNTHSCPVCLGMPGVLPVLNRQVIELAMRLALRTGGEIKHRSYFARKNYFYPDLPKGYQISMFEFPLIKGGHLNVETTAGVKKIRINRIHLEEDAGKLIHEEGHFESYFDVNRCGVPLIEIVTEPDFETMDEISFFLNNLKEILIFSGVSNGNMEQGNIRVDANISVRPVGTTELGTRTEIKNMNSFVNVVAAVTTEISRQIDILDGGGRIHQETLLYDSVKDVVIPMRSKEEAHDYRYFPEPDLVPIIVDEDWIERIRASLPELRDEMRERFIIDYGIPAYDAEIMTTSPAIAAYFEDTIKLGADPKKASNWIMGEVLRILSEIQTDITNFRVTPQNLVSLIALVDKKTISGTMAKTVFDEMSQTGEEPLKIVEHRGLVQISDKNSLKEIASQIISESPKEVEKYKAGKTQLLGFFVGQAMKLSKGKANPGELNTIFEDLLNA